MNASNEVVIEVDTGEDEADWLRSVSQCSISVIASFDYEHIHTHAREFPSLLSFIFTGPPGDHSALHRPRNDSATTLRFISLPPLGVLQWLKPESKLEVGLTAVKASALWVTVAVTVPLALGF